MEILAKESLKEMENMNVIVMFIQENLRMVKKMATEYWLKGKVDILESKRIEME